MTGKKITKTFLIFVFVLLYKSFSQCQSISITANVDKNRIGLNEQVHLQVTVTGDVSNIPSPELPPLNGFTAQSAGRSQNISIINGKVSSSITHSYYLVPKSVGKFIIDSITLNYKGQVYKTEAIEIEVVQASQGQQQSSGQQRQKTISQAGRRLFITASVDKKTAYVGEQITYIFRFYYNAQILSRPQYIPPDTSGFLVEDLPPQREFYTEIDGVGYNVVEVKIALFGCAPGKYTLTPAQLQCSISDFSPDDFFSGFFSMGKQQVLKTEPVEITVLPLPKEMKPSDFTGAVGQYKITAEFDKRNTKTNQPLTLIITVSGKGGIKTLPEPVIPEVKEFRKYQTLSSLNITKENYRVGGSKVFKTVLIPQVSGLLTYPEIKFSFFDPIEKVYKTVKTESLRVNVLPGEKEEKPSSVMMTPEGIKVISEDIRFIKTSFKGKVGKGQPLHKNAVFMIIQLFPAACVIFSYVYKLRSEKFLKDVKYARYTKAGKIARKKIREIDKRILSGKLENISGDIYDTFSGYIADKLNLSKAGLTEDIIREHLKLKNIEEKLLNEVIELWKEYDFIRFAPSGLNKKEYIERILERTQDLIDELEKRL